MQTIAWEERGLNVGVSVSIAHMVQVYLDLCLMVHIQLHCPTRTKHGRLT